MGHVVRITREPVWAESPADPIEADEWADLVDEDDELEWDAANGIHDALWTCGEDKTPFWYEDGVISTKNPSDEAIRKMYRMAERLVAVVEGEEGERYDARGEQFYTPEHQALIDRPRNRPLPLADRIMIKLSAFKRLLGRA